MKSSRRVALGTTFGAMIAAPAFAAKKASKPGGAIHVADFGAMGDGVTDDSAAIASACNHAAKKYQAGEACFIKFGSGRFLLRSTNLPVFERAPVGIRGEGPGQTVILVDSEYSGDIFSWSDCWDTSSYGLKSRTSLYASGVFIEDIAFLGSLDRSTVVHAVSFYDINDNVRMHNVQFDYINGSAIRAGGLTKTRPIGILRESRFSEIRVFCCGTPDFAAIEIGSSGSSDATNEIVLNTIDIFRPGGDGLAITNSGSQPLRLFKVFGLRVEKFPSGKFGLRVGKPDSTAEIYGLNIMGAELITGEKGSVAIGLLGQTDRQVIGCCIQGQIINCHGDGVLVTAGKYNKIDLLLNESHGKALTLIQTKNPLYYSCQNPGSLNVAPGCVLLTPGYVPYHGT